MILLWELFLSFLKIGTFSFGGGYGALPLIEQEIIVGHKWMTNKEFIDVITMSEMTPGSLSINGATFVGNHVAGVKGAIVATLGVVLPSAVITLALAVLYYKFKDIDLVQGVIQGLRPAVVALIAVAGVAILSTSLFGGGATQLGNLDIVSVLMIAGVLGLFYKTRLGPIHVMVLAGILGIFIFQF